MRISKHISYKEGIKSNTAIRKGIDNTPSPLVIGRMQDLAENVFEPLRGYFDVPIGISSFYRSPELNEAIGGSDRSQHCKGEAMDIDADIYGSISNKEIFDYIKDNLNFDQMIWEFGNDEDPSWVHVSYSESNRKQILKAIRKKGRVYYESF